MKLIVRQIIIGLQPTVGAQIIQLAECSCRGRLVRAAVAALVGNFAGGNWNLANGARYSEGVVPGFLQLERVRERANESHPRDIKEIFSRERPV